jgi:hypothetical protein
MIELLSDLFGADSASDWLAVCAILTTGGLFGVFLAGFFEIQRSDAKWWNLVYVPAALTILVGLIRLGVRILELLE